MTRLPVYQTKKNGKRKFFECKRCEKAGAEPHLRFEACPLKPEKLHKADKFDWLFEEADAV